MDKRGKRILIFRFSAIGDIAIAAPLVRAYAKANPDISFTMVSQPKMEALFTDISNLCFFPVDFKGRYRDFKGVFKLYKDLSRLKPTHIADLHNVLRTWILRSLYALSFKKITFLHKGRNEKRRLTRKENKDLRQLPAMVSRYESVLVKAGLENLHFSDSSDGAIGRRKQHSSDKKGEDVVKIGIAPFAKHKGKAWPAEFMEEVIAELNKDARFKILLFGGGKSEVSQLQSWEQKYSGAESVAGKFSLAKELEIMKDLDLMISMDSANMHLASFVGTTVLSIWGATHPYAGFYGWGQKVENALQIDLSCRPCSVFGNKECYRGDYACMMNIKPGVVLDSVRDIVKERKND
ncbi:MAG: glycosyltransferase family 9 protein [Rikenellaceae bacterium]